MLGCSCYDGLPPASLTIKNGTGGTREVSYLLPRTPLSPEQATPMAAHRVAPDDRLDLIATRYLGDPAAFWRICDVNLALDPDGLVDSTAGGSLIVIPAPGV
jgi:hypothetical protein